MIQWIAVFAFGLASRTSGPDRYVYSSSDRSVSHRCEKPPLAVRCPWITDRAASNFKRYRASLPTYVACSAELEIEKGKFRYLPLRRLSTITTSSRRSCASAAVEKKVASHAMRHIACLIQTDPRDGFKNAIQPTMIKAFEELQVPLEGQVFEGKQT